MGFWFWVYVVSAVFFLIVSTILFFTADPWLWAGPMALAQTSIIFAKEGIKSD